MSYPWPRLRQHTCPSPILRPGTISLTCAQLLAILPAMRDAFRTIAALRSALSTRRDLLFEHLALRTSWVFSLVPIDASARPTVCSGCACDGCGLGGGTHWCWSSRPRSPVG